MNYSTCASPRKFNLSSLNSTRIIEKINNLKRRIDWDGMGWDVVECVLSIVQHHILESIQVRKVTDARCVCIYLFHCLVSAVQYNACENKQTRRRRKCY